MDDEDGAEEPPVRVMTGKAFVGTAVEEEEVARVGVDDVEVLVDEEVELGTVKMGVEEEEEEDAVVVGSEAVESVGRVVGRVAGRPVDVVETVGRARVEELVFPAVTVATVEGAGRVLEELPPPFTVIVVVAGVAITTGPEELAPVMVAVAPVLVGVTVTVDTTVWVTVVPGTVTVTVAGVAPRVVEVEALVVGVAELEAGELEEEGNESWRR